jgi:hypothetical protein
MNKEKWFSLNYVEQMANMGGEFLRAINWRKNNEEYSKSFLKIGFEWLDLTIDDPKNKNNLQDLLLLREKLKDYFCFDNIYGSNDKIWNDYFYQFAVAARK